MTDPKTGLISDAMSLKIIDATESLVMSQGAANLNVRKILHELNITNRVFYNRFHNIDEVLEIVYESTIKKMRESMRKFDPEGDFFEQVSDIVADTLIMSYNNKMQFSDYVFANDSVSQDNFIWWTESIKALISFAKERDIIKNVDPDIISYAVWCFCRGYNADAVRRKLPRDEAVKNFRYAFGIFLEGLKK